MTPYMSNMSNDVLAWPWRVRVYAPENLGGHLLIETRHSCESSKDVEVLAALSRRKAGEVGHIDVENRRLGHITRITRE